MRSKPTGFLIVCLGSLVIGAVFLLLAGAHDWRVALNTLWLGIGASLIAIPMGGLIAWAIRSRNIFSRLLLVACVGMLGIPVLLQASGWDSAFGKLGWLTSQRGQILQPILSGWSAAIWIHGIAAIPQVVIIFLIGMSLGKKTYQEQALLEADRWTVFWHVSLPGFAPLLVAASLWTMIGCAREIAVTDLYQIGTLAEQIYLGFSLGQLTMPGANWTAEELKQAENLGPLITILLIAWLTVCSIWFFQKLMPAHVESIQSAGPATSHSRHPKLQMAVAIVFLLIVVAIPVANLLIRASFYVINMEGTPLQAYSVSQIFSAIGRALKDQQYSFFWSSAIAIVASTTILCCASIGTWFARKSQVWRWALLFSLAIASAVPGPLLGKVIAYAVGNSNVAFLNWLYNYTIFAPVLANAIFCWPMGAIIVWYLFQNVAHDASDSARTEGAGEWSQIIYLAVWGNWPALLGAWMIVFSVCFGELSASQLVTPAGIQTVPASILGFMHAGVDEMTAALTIVTSLGLVAISLLGWGIVWLKYHRNSQQ